MGVIIQIRVVKATPLFWQKFGAKKGMEGKKMIDGIQMSTNDAD
jgi:hypothetical protein